MFYHYAEAQVTAMKFILIAILSSFLFASILHFMFDCGHYETKELIQPNDTVITTKGGVTDTTYIYNIKPF
jgi:hypothetical protein